MANAAKSSNPLIGDNFFNANPEKVLGTQRIARGRFGDIIKVDGQLSNIEKIDVPAIPIVDLYPAQEFATLPKEEIIQKVFENEFDQQKEERMQKIRSPFKKTKKEASASNLQASQEVYSFREFSELYNKDISRDEMEAYYFTHPELNYKLLLDGFTNTKNELLAKGLICWDNSGKPAYVYVYSYQSGNINKKITALENGKDKFISEFGQEQYDRQLKFLYDVKPKQKGVTGDDRFILLPHSDFAKSIRISELRGKPELNSEVNLVDAFSMWLRVQPSDVFDKSNYDEIITYYLKNKNIPIDKNHGKEQQIKEEKDAINMRQRTKEEGDKLFAKFMAEDLLQEDQARIAYLWNEKYNSFADPNLAKTPVCLQMSKTFKSGAPLYLNATQRQAAAFMQEKKSGLLAYGVGVGKTIASILCAGQAHYNGFSNKPMFIVPTNTYDNWIAEIQGGVDKQTGKFIQGIMPQLPPVVGLYNLNSTIVRDKLKIYSKSDEKEFERIENTISVIRKVANTNNTNNFTKEQEAQIQKAYPDLNLRGLKQQFEILLIEKGSTGRAKNFPEFVINYLKDEYNYLIYELGTIREFPAGTIFVTTENGLQRLGVSDANKEKMEDSLYEILSQGEKTADIKNNREIAQLLLKIKQRISSSLKNAKLNIEDLEVDWVCFDEAHYYKKLFTFVKGEIKDTYDDKDGNTKYKRDKSKYELKSGAVPSGRALSAYVISHYIQMHHDNRNVVMLTATPFTNSPLEVYSMLVLTNFKALQEMGLGNMVEFFDTFMKINYDIKYTPQKTVKKDIVLTGYNNLSNLRQVIYSLMDKKDEGANLKRPIKELWPSIVKGIETTIPMTAEQNDLMKQVKDYINGKGDLSKVCDESVVEEIDEIDFDGLDDDALVSEWEKYTQKEFEGDRDFLSDAKRDALIAQIRQAMKKDVTSGVDFDEKDLDEDEGLGVRILRGINLMKQITLSPFLFHKACSKAQSQKYDLPHYLDFINTSPKLLYTMGCIKSVIDFHKSRGEKISGQVIYMANGIEYFPLIKEYLVKELHLTEMQVGIVSGGMSKSAKEGVKARFLNGDCLVLIGSQTISVGVNLQNNASVLYNLWYDWNPTDAAQIEGRIWRQGNRHQYVRIVYPQCFNSCDPVIFEYLSAKTLRINEIWNRSSEVQELDLKDFNPKELQKKLITDPEERADWEILEERDRIDGDVRYYENRRDSLVYAQRYFKQYHDLKPKAIAYLNEISEKRAQIKREEGIRRVSDKLAEINEKFMDDPEKLMAEIKKLNEGRYDHKNDPDGRYVAEKYDDQTDDDALYQATNKLANYISDLSDSKASVWGDIYYQRRTIAEYLYEFRNAISSLDYMQERILKPMGISLATAANPIAEFDRKLKNLRDQLDLVEKTREEKIKRYTREYKELMKNLKTVDDRVAEFAAQNAKLLPPQLLETNIQVVEDIEHEEVSKAALPEPAELLAEEKVEIPVVPIEQVEEIPEEILSQALQPHGKRVSRRGIKNRKAGNNPNLSDDANEVVKTENTPEIKSTEELKTDIENQIEGLTLARDFAGPAEQSEIDSQIEALKLTLNFI